MRKATLILITVFLLCISFASAQVITQHADALNFDDSSKNMTVTVTYTCSGSRQFNVTVPSGSGFTIDFTTDACTRPTSTRTVCYFNGQTSGTYTISHSNPSSLADYTVYEFPSFLNDTSNCTVVNNVSFIKIPDHEIFHTLVEFGRGRGNYFYDTFAPGKAGSGHTGVGCNYVPNGSMFELNFLHKILNIRQYFNDVNLVAKNATFTCSYPNRTIVRTHLGTTISKSSSETNVTYFIDEIEGSWERMGFLGMDFDASEQNVGDNLTITCRDISYSLVGAGGDITVFVNGTTLNLQVRNKEPFTASASTTATIGNGSQEVIIVYNITNTELYTANNVIIEIEAPQYATFIGTRGELWGTALDQYRIEKTELKPNVSEIIMLVARFNTSTAPSMSSINLTSGVKIQYITCWEANAYNPQEYMQYLYGIGTGSVNMGVPAAIVGIQSQINDIYILLSLVNTTTININNTVNLIENLVNIINATTIDTNTVVKQINNTVNIISNRTDQILNNTVLIINDTTEIKELIDCDNVSDSPMCSWIDDINTTATNIQNILIQINQTLSNYSVNITVNLSNQNLSINVTPDLTNISIIIEDIKAELNCSNVTGEPNTSICKRAIRIENNTIIINNTVNTINSLINYFNSTVFGNITLQDIYDSITNITVDTSSLLDEIRRVREFDEELVFLVTDAFGMQQAARNDLSNGNVGAAAEKLRQANEKLKLATERLIQTQGDIVREGPVAADSGFQWVIISSLIIIAAGMVFMYLFSKPK